MLLGYLLAVAVAIPIGFLIGMSPLMSRALDPFIQIMKPISPLAWMPLALYTIKDSGISAIFVIFICSVWPMLINTAFGVATVRREWLNVAKTLEMSPARTAWRVILPAAAPTILTGMRISIGIAWLVIVAAEMLVGGTGIGYFVWNEWNNLSITNVITAILFIGVIGMAARPADGQAAAHGGLCGLSGNRCRSSPPPRGEGLGVGGIPRTDVLQSPSPVLPPGERERAGAHGAPMTKPSSASRA